jgi:hypothetical protein
MKLPGDTQTRYQAIIGSQVAGPYTLEGLESLVYLGKVTPDTLISVEGRFEFTSIRASAFSRRLFPLLEESNPAGAGGGSRERFQMTEAKFEKVADRAPPSRRIDVMDILDDLRQQEIASGRDLGFGERFKVSRRSIDFWIMLVAGNTVIVGGGILMQNTGSIVFGFAGAGLYTFGLLWSMYGVMDRY